MKKFLAVLSLGFLFCVTLAAQRDASKSAKKVPAAAPAGAFVTGKYRNLFLEAGHSQQEISRKIEAAFQQLFHGDPGTQTVCYVAGSNANGPLAYLSDINNQDVRSEGMSYGMTIAVQMNQKAEFDALWNWSRTFMYHDSPTHPAYGFFSWPLKPDGTPNSESPAPDGEEYYAMALYFASARWGNGTGIYDYRAAADRLLSDMKNRGAITGPWSRGGRTETDGAEFSLEHRMVRFTPDNRRPARAGIKQPHPGILQIQGHRHVRKPIHPGWHAATRQFRYYDGMWYLMGLLDSSGEFRIWAPK